MALISADLRSIGNARSAALTAIRRIRLIAVSLTGLPNRRCLEQFLTREVSRAYRHSRPLALLLFDVDHFKAINDCLGHPNGSVVDNIEDVDTVVGWLAESTRPHGFAISETQFVVFILNASRRLFSDRFFTSSFRPEFYTKFGVDWVNNNGPGAVQMEQGTPNGHTQPVSPLKRFASKAWLIAASF